MKVHKYSPMGKKIMNCSCLHNVFGFLGTHLPFRVSKSAILPSSDNKILFMIGGWNDNIKKVSNVVLQYSLITGNWTTSNISLHYGRQYPLAFYAPLQHSSCGKQMASILLEFFSFISNFVLLEKCFDSRIEVFYNTSTQEYTYFPELFGFYKKDINLVNGRSFYEHQNKSTPFGIWWACEDRWCINYVALKGSCVCLAFKVYEGKCITKTEDWNWFLKHGEGVWKPASRGLGIRKSGK